MKKISFKEAQKVVEEATNGTVYAATLVRGPRDARDKNGGYHTRFLTNWNTWEYFKNLQEVMERFSN